jgi:hypothetical protein
VTHGCVGPRCAVVLARDDEPMCGLHWLMVPPALRRDIEAARAGGGTASTAYAAAVLAAIAAVTAKLQPAG